MAKGLMHECKNRTSINCNPEVRKHFVLQKKETGEELPIMPVGSELEKLDAICEECEFFESVKKKN
jgi:hypothetical protein